MIQKIKVEVMIGSILNHDKYVNAHEINEEIATLNGMNAWIKSAKVFQKKSKRRGKKDVRHFLLVS